MNPDSGPAGDEALVEALTFLQSAVTACAFDLPTPAQDERRRLRDRLAADLGGHIARLRDLDAPLLVVVGGVTGAGKSTFVNTLLGRSLLAAGPVRPTTHSPTLVCHPDDAEWFTDRRVLPSLPRVEAPADVTVEGAQLRLVRSAAIPPGLAVLDAPDVDSVDAANRELADALLDAADLWLWFTTGGKYADEDSMRYLRRARARRTALAVVLTQVAPADLDEVSDDFRVKLGREELAGARLFTIPTTRVTNSRLPADVVTSLRGWLHGLAPIQARHSHRLQTLSGALDALPADVRLLRDALDDEIDTARSLIGAVDRAYDDARREFDDSLTDGLPLRSEVVARWDRFVGGGRFLKATEAATGQARTWIKGLLNNLGLTEEQRLEREVRVEVADTVAGLIGQLADLAAAETARRWSADPAGRALLNRTGDLTRRSSDFDDRAESSVRAWQRTVADRVGSVGAQRRMQARVLSGAVSVAATSAMLVAMASTGITGAEAGIAAAAGAANQALLTKVLGEANLRRLIADARADLLERFADVTASERARFRGLVAESAPDPDDIVTLSEASARVAVARGARG